VASRPALQIAGSEAADAARAVDRLVQELQAGWDTRDADVTDRHLGDDVLWGSPFGATLQGYDRLHGIHEELKQRSVGGRSSRFELVQWLAPADGVAVAQVRRTALDDSGEPVAPAPPSDQAFSEMALYVLVERDGDWWVAAGQNTPVTK
jgi:uncharacterized protein (TIGR02246 family)